jgi:hypothetical protein
MIKSNTYVRNRGLELMIFFFLFDPTTNVLAMGLITLGDVAHFVVKGFRVTKSFRVSKVERKNLDLHHVFTIFNKLSTFIAQTI